MASMEAEHPEVLPEHGDPDAPTAAEGEAATPSVVTRVRACLVVLGGEEFAVDVRCLREVMVVGKPTAVPGAPSFVRGVANLRGEVITIVDLGPVLGLPVCAAGPTGKALVLEPAPSQVAIVVDDVLGLETFDEVRQGEDPASTNRRAAFGAGWLPRGGRLIPVLDVVEVVEILKIRAGEAAASRG